MLEVILLIVGGLGALVALQAIAQLGRFYRDNPFPRPQVRGQPDDWPTFPGAGAEAAYLERKGWSADKIAAHLHALDRD